MHEHFIERMQAAIEKLQDSAARGRLKDVELARRRLGRIQQRYWRAPGAFDVKITKVNNSVGKDRLHAGPCPEGALGPAGPEITATASSNRRGGKIVVKTFSKNPNGCFKKAVLTSELRNLA